MLLSIPNLCQISVLKYKTRSQTSAKPAIPDYNLSERSGVGSTSTDQGFYNSNDKIEPMSWATTRISARKGYLSF
jgi:hypothetical protein